MRARHKDALAELFSSVLGLCRRAGLVKVGVIAIDGTKMHCECAYSNRCVVKVRSVIAL